MGTRLWPQLALTALALLVIIGGIATVGGPETARVEQRDDQRFAELRRLIWQARCLSGEDGVPPETLAETESCQLPLEDDALLREEGYSYERGQGRDFKICAEFENLESTRHRQTYGRLDADGCLDGKP
ncbi:MAG: hypothetical protein HWE33_02290 [Rhodobacteraceae bacterium]|uniref:hypothetical protein n=1 Tax=Celeribacter sp. HF31 TaxID=2721558 RepID=UPI001430FB21|nr:hypothetical protein [Celeribacter sp. HF31]NIY80887.1 hypothetical protein [Celeribacter sp. HF31]NVK45106.1 hypothetical protein [Paracoccaceae bacterium]